MLAGGEPSVAECLLAQRPHYRQQTHALRAKRKSAHIPGESYRSPAHAAKKNEFTGFWNFLFISSKPLQQTFLTNLLHSHYPLPFSTPLCLSIKKKKRGGGRQTMPKRNEKSSQYTVAKARQFEPSNGGKETAPSPAWQYYSFPAPVGRQPPG